MCFQRTHDHDCFNVWINWKLQVVDYIKIYIWDIRNTKITKKINKETFFSYVKCNGRRLFCFIILKLDSEEPLPAIGTYGPLYSPLDLFKTFTHAKTKANSFYCQNM